MDSSPGFGSPGGSGPDEVSEKRKSAYSSRLSRARTANLEKGRLTRGNQDSLANMAFSIPVQAEVDQQAAEVSAARATAARAAPPPKPTRQLTSEATTYIKPEEDGQIAAFWEWNDEQKMCAVVRRLPQISDRAPRSAAAVGQHPPFFRSLMKLQATLTRDRGC